MKRFLNFVRHSPRVSRNGLLATLVVMSSIVVPTHASAQSTSRGCWKITSLTTNKNSNLYTDPGTVASSWTGSTDGGGKGAYPMTIQINTPPFVPDGTLLASGVAPMVNLGDKGVGGYSPEQVLFRCSPDSAGTMFEYYSTNGDNAYAGYTNVSAQSGIPETYETYYTGVVSRVTNMTTGEYVSRYWKATPLTNLDVDSQGWFLVKAKNFSQYKMEFFQCSTCPVYDNTSTGAWAYSQPVAYSAFVGGASGTIIKGNLSVGADSLNHYDGWYGNWPGSINPYGNVTVRRSATCAVTNATPVVNFPSITIGELNQGGSRQLPITIQMQCQTTKPANLAAFASGTAPNQTALGILAPPANAQTATSVGLTTTGSGVSYLLSDGYGTDPGAATGVGVALSRPGGAALNFLTNEYVTAGGTKDGWDPVLNDASANGPASGGMTSYTRTINATFKAFAPRATPVTAGKFNATAQVIVRVQ
ncbi:MULTISPECIES: fimbrial protein [Paraburkholderia]|uniref:fimbrial protein n=1 Tax=Paraburkholderia TaxID=1822464 RepID=UPI0003A7DF92|nr:MULTISPECIES: fimbrial protein [Paraburkholderia]MDH6153026.1 type 1 fimbria pilin [Paraburkholderia sp. WSM4179]